MVRYKLQFRESKGKRYYDFRPTVTTTAKPRYSKIDSLAKARSVKKELEKIQKDRHWKIRKK